MKTRLYTRSNAHTLGDMEIIITGKAYVLGDNIDTDQFPKSENTSACTP
jgi:hypothetical protein